MTARQEDDGWVRLPPPFGATPTQRRKFSKLAREIEAADGPAECVRIARALPSNGDAALRASTSILADLVAQGWRLRTERGVALVEPPDSASDPTAEKQRVRNMELWKREEQLQKPSVRRFISKMEAPRLHEGNFVSVFDLMRDGGELSAALADLGETGATDSASLRSVIDPYVQIVDESSRCAFTGLRLLDVWRYFRHTWVTQYSTTPGRTMMVLVRDAASSHHAVIGIAAVASPIVQISERDEWIGWQPEQFLAVMESEPSAELARWVMSCLNASLDEVYLDDLIADGLYWPALWADPDADAIGRLRKESAARRQDHARFVRASDHKHGVTSDRHWVRRAESDLFRSKRAALVADLLAARLVLVPFLLKQSKANLKAALQDPAARHAISTIVRRAKGASVGTEIADLSVCGSIAPYNELLGGKLVSMLSVSPSVVRAYHEKYAGTPSEIASSMAGRPIYRRSNLVYVGTTSLYGAGSSQYNRIRIPDGTLGGSRGPVVFEKLGRSKSYGTSHLSARSMAALVSLAQQQGNGRRINSIFGEGVNPKLRKAREGLDLLGWPSNALLRHGRERIVYGVPLVRNLLPYLLGLQARPQYLYDVSNPRDAEEISDYWMTRWLAGRIGRPEVLDRVTEHSLVRPVVHGARVVLPETDPHSER